MREKTKDFTDEWFWVEMPDKEFPHAVLLNDPIQGECVAQFKDAINAQLFCKEQALWQLEREFKHLRTPINKEKLQAKNKKLCLALEIIKNHDTHNLYNNQGNAYKMAKIAEQALF